MKMRNKLLAATAMLIVSAIMMTTASFAWFSISTAPEANIKTQVAANGNLEIALGTDLTTKPSASALGDATTGNTTWGNLVDLDDTAIGMLRAIGFNSGAPAHPTYVGGRLEANLTALTATTTNGVTTYKDASGNIWAVQLNVWLRTNVEGKIFLEQDAAQRVNGDTTTTGSGTTLSGDFRAKMKIATGTQFVTNFATAKDVSFVRDTNATDLATLASDVELITIDSTNVNTEIAVSVLIYMDGTSLTNEDMTNVITDLIVNLQFSHSDTLIPMIPDQPTTT